MSESDIERDFRAMLNFENYCWECTEDSVKKAKELIPFVDPIWAHHLVCYAVANHRLFHWDLIADIFSGFPEHHVKNFGSQFICYLYKKGLVTEDEVSSTISSSESLLTIREYEEKVAPKTLEWYIKKDDVPSLTYYLTNHPDVNVVLQQVTVYDTIYTLPNFAAFCGSLNVLKFLMVQGCVVDQETVKYAVASGNEDIIEFLVSKRYNFDNMLFYAIVNHHNDIAKWLMDNYHCEKNIFLPDCIQLFNTEMFLFIMDEKNKNVNEKNYYTMTPLMIAAVQNNIPLCKFMLSIGANIYCSDDLGQMAIDLATTDEMRALLA